MFAYVAGVSLVLVLLVIWSALYQEGLLWDGETKGKNAETRPIKKDSVGT